MIELPVIAGRTDQSYRISIEGVEYLIGLRFSNRFTRWYFSLSDVDGNPIHSQIRMVIGYRLLQFDVDERRPSGDFYVFGPLGSEGQDEIGLNDLGTVNKFYYMTADEIQALKPEPSPDEILVVS